MRVLITCLFFVFSALSWLQAHAKRHEVTSTKGLTLQSLSYTQKLAILNQKLSKMDQVCSAAIQFNHLEPSPSNIDRALYESQWIINKCLEAEISSELSPEWGNIDWQWIQPAYYVACEKLVC